MSLNSTYIRTDVTAVSFYRNATVNLMLAGIGSSVFVYAPSSKKPIQRLLCLNGQKIYGFIHQDSGGCGIIVFGGKQFTLVVGPDSDNDPIVFTRLFEPVVCDDWLHSAAWTVVDKTVSVLTAHNVVQKYNASTLALVSYHSSRDNSILYSGLLLALQRSMLVMAGTVYSEVILHICGEDDLLHRLKGHKGVIFSISCYPEKNIIVTTSDDRSVRIWGPNVTPNVPWDSTEYWRSEIVCKHELYGHNARVMRSSITENQILSVGEDSRICFWTHEGVLVRKVKRHQNAGIWSIKACSQYLITGGGDGAVILQYLTAAKDEYHKSDVLNLDISKPKHIAYSAKGNLFILYENNKFIYYDVEKKASIELSCKNDFETTFHAMSVSPNREMCALAGNKSIIKVVAENRLDCNSKFITVKVNLEDETILSVHWAGYGLLVACTQDGIITVLTVSQMAVEPYTVFGIPNCKERWLTSAAADHTRQVFILGDRCGDIHLYRKGSKLPLKTFTKLHGRYGPNSITLMNDEMITMGRDRTIKYYKINGNEITHTVTKELNFHWVDRFLDSDDSIVCGFKEKMFVVYCLRTNEKLIELACGGGQRSWDVLYYHEGTSIDAKPVLKLVYLKNSNINIETISFGKIASITVANGSHSKEINCLKTHQIAGRTIFISGGEDTTLRVSSLNNEMQFDDLVICKHLSSVRTLKMYTKDRDEILVISAGGRAQICVNFYKFNRKNDKIVVETRDLVDYMLKGTDKERKGDENWKNVSVDPEPETRIMDLDYIVKDKRYTIFAGCSDARVRVFVFNGVKVTFKMINQSSCTRNCILKTSCVTFLKYDLLITCSTRGEVAFWNATNINKVDAFEPFFVTKTNKSGINSLVTRNLPNNRILIATGGDDNALHLNVLFVADRHNLSSMQVLYSLILDKHHSSAITGLCLVDDYILSSSIDQRITLSRWKVSDKIECNFVYQTFSDIADIKGMDLITQNSASVSVCVFGKGIEVFKIPTSVSQM